MYQSSSSYNRRSLDKNNDVECAVNPDWSDLEDDDKDKDDKDKDKTTDKESSLVRAAAAGETYEMSQSEETFSTWRDEEDVIGDGSDDDVDFLVKQNNEAGKCCFSIRLICRLFSVI